MDTRPEGLAAAGGDPYRSMYTAYFGLTEAPFPITPDPRYFYMSERHRDAFAPLLYGIGEGGGFVQLTGEVGTGKTMLCRCLLEQLPPHVNVALVLNPRLRSIELLATVCDELKIAYPPGATIEALIDSLQQYLLEAHERGRSTVVIIDEAQDLSGDVLDKIRWLANVGTTTQTLLQVILIGQPELSRLLESPGLRQVAQRVTARYHLTPLSKRETHAYIRHRLEVAGGHGRLFSPTAVRQVHRLSGGVPRLINVICDRALLGAFAEDKKRVNGRTARRAGAEVLWGRTRQRHRVVRMTKSAVVAVIAVAIVASAAILASKHRVIVAFMEGTRPGSGDPAGGSSVSARVIGELAQRLARLESALGARKTVGAGHEDSNLPNAGVNPPAVTVPVAPSSTSPAVPTPAPASGEDRAAALRGLPKSVPSATVRANRIHRLRAMEGEAETWVRVEAEGPLTYRAFTLAAPPRLVVDFETVAYALDRNTLPVGGQILQRIRSSRFRDSPVPVVRLVFDLTRLVPYWVEPQESGVVVHLATSRPAQRGR